MLQADSGKDWHSRMANNEKPKNSLDEIPTRIFTYSKLIVRSNYHVQLSS